MQLDRDKQLIEDELRRILAEEQNTTSPLVFACLQHAVLSGGKRLRPLLGLSTARTVRGDAGECLTAVAAVELLHCASLVIDDLPCMDNEMFRRSRRAAHAQFGEPIAILSAFALVLLGIRVTQRQSGRQTPSWRLFQTMVVDSLLRNGLIAGQEADITGRRDDNVARNTLKTAPLFELACAAGLVGADVTSSVRSTLLMFGRTYGQTFQALDDVADGDAVDETEVKNRVAACRRHLEEVRRLGFETRYLLPFIERLQPDGIPHEGPAR